MVNSPRGKELGGLGGYGSSPSLLPLLYVTSRTMRRARGVSVPLVGDPAVPDCVEQARRAVSRAIGECVVAETPSAEMITAMRGVDHLGMIFLRTGEPEERRMTLMEAGMFLLAVGADTAIYGADRFLGFDLDEETPDLRGRLLEDPNAVEAIVTAVVTGKEFRGHARPYHHGRAWVTFDDEIELPGCEVAGAMPGHLRWILEHRPALPASPDQCLKFLSARGHSILFGRSEP